MKLNLKITVVLLILGSLLLADINIIPKPTSVTETDEEFVINKKTKILYENEGDLGLVADFLQDMVLAPTGMMLEKTDKASKNYISLDIDKNLKGDPGSYQLSVKDKKIEIIANSAIGCFYGVQSLRQLLPAEIESIQPLYYMKWTVPGVEIHDEPRFQYRGMHLDVGRHFFTVDFIKKYIDLLALHKMNKFHWHLTEDQGWRIEIKKYPKLTEISAFRDETVVNHAGNSDLYDGKPYGGFYTQEEVKEIVAYANSRFVTVIPEIELPGHSQAVLAAYPELGCTGGPYKVSTTWGVRAEVYCAGRDETFEFLQNVMDEVVELFPSKYIHIGGDECPKSRWKKCPVCQQRIKDEHLEDEHELQSYFIQRMEKYLLGKDRYIIGWDEILEGGLAPQATVMSWRGVSGGITAAKQKHDVIMTPNSHCYLDHYQSDPKTEPLAIGGFLPLEKVYSYEPIPEELTKEEEKYILGVQGNVWTEYMKTPEYVEYMAFPRAIALSEVGWSVREQKDFSDFKKRLQNHNKRLDRLHVNYFTEIPKPIIEKNYISFTKTAEVVIENPLRGSTIYYTMDGSEPNKKSIQYKSPITVKSSTILKAITHISGSNEVSKPVTVKLEKLEFNKSQKLSKPQEGLTVSMKNGEFWKLSKYRSAKVEKKFVLNSVEIPKDAPKANYGYTFSGFIKADTKGIYNFVLTSDDGSELLINGKQVINNDGAHGPIDVRGAVALYPGFHKFEVNFFQIGGGATLNLKWKTPESEEEIPINSNYFFK